MPDMKEPYQFSKVIWHSDKVAESGRWQRLYRMSLPNPEPKKAVSAVELVSSRSEATLIVLAATLDRLAPGARSDDSPDLEPTDIAELGDRGRRRYEDRGLLDRGEPARRTASDGLGGQPVTLALVPRP